MQTGGGFLGNWADEMDAVDAISGNQQEVGIKQQQAAAVAAETMSGVVAMRDQIPWDVLFLGDLPQGFSKIQVKDIFHDLQVLNILELVCSGGSLYGYYVEFGSCEDFLAAFESIQNRVPHKVTKERVPYNYYVEYRQKRQKERSKSDSSNEHKQERQKQQEVKKEIVKPKSNPFGDAKPVDTTKKLLEIEARKRKEMLTKENVEAAAAKASVAVYSLTPRSSPYPTREQQCSEQVNEAQLAAEQAIYGRPLTSPGRGTPPPSANGHLLIAEDFDDRASHYSYNSNQSYNSRGGSYRSRGGRGRYGRGGRPMRSGVFDGPHTRQSYSRPESRNSNAAEPRYGGGRERDEEVMSQASHMSGRSNYSRNGEIAIISRTASRGGGPDRPPIPSSSSSSVSRGGRGGRFSTPRPRASRAEGFNTWRRD